ncbi:MAG TPA: Ku protein [Acidobacteriota bacterium]|nr:Ku protein [Acidobacteriota bacterium]
MKAIWKGSISFGLVNIPIKLYSAIEHSATKMRLLHKQSLEPINYKRFAQGSTKEVPWSDIVKGVELTKGVYVVLTPEEIKTIRPEKTQRIEILEFTDVQQVDPIYFDSHYYLAPEKSKDKTYHLFQEVLSQTAKMAIGSFVMREKEYICAIEAYKDGLLLTTLNYAYEIRDINQLEEIKTKPKLSKQELDLAKELINKIYNEQFDMSKFKDSFAEGLKTLVKKKSKGQKIVIEQKEVPKTVERDLVAALKASLR